ncbi:MAG TPA: DUF5652 family protein [Candidatus Paceibacterota bacterium]|nr:DUF5652 family protein [Candidatus Paceibacterota bacterium]
MFSDILEIPVNRELWFIALFLWTVSWKGMALWRAARLERKEWFIPLLLINTLGVLEILYIYVFSQPKEPKEEKK